MFRAFFKFNIFLIRNIHIPKESCIVSGVQPTGQFHIGNLFGVFNQWATLQNDAQNVLYFIADLHAITTYQNPTILKSNILDAVASLISCGIDQERVILFQQSQVKEHAELAWILGCLTTLSKLDYLPVWKQRDSNKSSQSLGLYAYPVLQAADILIYQATHVPIGQDQLWHLHLTQHLVQKLNQLYGNQFPIPQPLLSNVARLKSLKDPTKKMSKSDSNANSRINLIDGPDEIRFKIRKALTATINEPITINYYKREDKIDQEKGSVNRSVGIENLKDIYMALNVEGKANFETSEFKSIQEFKETLSEMLINRLGPIRKAILELRQDPLYLETILRDGSDKARSIANITLTNIKKAIGL